jgi:ribosome maturation factor RimP
MASKLKEQIIELIEKPLQESQAELADLVLSQYKSSTTLRLFVYSESGVTLEKCARLSRMVGDLIDGTDLLNNGYTLEVSSPGLDRPLKSALDFKYRIGETVRLEFVEKGRKKITAEIVAVNDEQIDFKIDSKQITVGIAEIDNAKILF